MEKHKNQLSNFEQAKQTITSLNTLYTVQGKLDRPDLTNQVKELTGLLIHAADNYPTVESFRGALRGAINALKNIYETIKNDNDRNRFLHCALQYKGCLEGRIEQILDYSYTIKTTYGLLKYESQLFNLSNGLPPNQAVHIDDLVVFLKAKIFFNVYGLKEEGFSKMPDIDKLEKRNLITTNTLDISERISEIFTIYTDHGTGLVNFKKYLLDYCDLRLFERKNIDQIIVQFCKVHPDLARLI